jgi:hypothetical protein
VHLGFSRGIHSAAKLPETNNKKAAQSRHSGFKLSVTLPFYTVMLYQQEYNPYIATKLFSFVGSRFANGNHEICIGFQLF